ncbi:MAG: DNA polymerase III subunit alpha [Thermoleophilia bacterium]
MRQSEDTGGRPTTSNPGLNGLPIRRIPPSHDYIRRDGAGPKDGWARGPADPGPAPAAAGAVTSTEDVPATPDPAPGDHLPPPKDDGIPPSFVHLHVHSNFSFLDGGSRITELVDRAAELGQPALALTDHDGLYGAVRFAKACIRRGLQPIFGAEVCVEPLTGEPPTGSDEESAGTDGVDAGAAPCVPRTAGGLTCGGLTGHTPAYLSPGPPLSSTEHPYHLVLLAETREGYANLCRLVSAAHLAIPERDRPPTLTAAQLREHREGIICLTGCRQGELARLVDAGRETEALHVLRVLRDIFGPECLFVELQHFGYRPHREAETGQDGAPVYHKVRGEDGRLRHFRDDGHPTGRDASGGSSDTRATRDPGSLRPGTGRSRVHTQPRPDLPSGRPQRLDPSDFDVGFHAEGTPWSLACLTYCDRLLQLARQCSLPAILTTDAHYARPEDRPVHLVCRAAGRDEPLSGYPAPAPGVRCLRPRAELETELQPLIDLHCHCNATYIATTGGDATLVGKAAETGAPDPGLDSAPGARVTAGVAAEVGPALLLTSPLDTPALIAARCHVDLELGTYHFPEVAIPPGETAYSLLAKRCFRGVERFYRPVPQRAVELLDHELAMIEQMGFAHYFLVVHDIVRWARARGIACSGRGSAGNSLVCHVLDITASEPIRHNLLFERFLNPNRREMPDIDVDFCSTRRDEVIDHIYDTFGDRNVAVVANVNTMSPRMAVRIAAEAVGFAPTEINALAKNVPRHGDAAKMRDYLAGEWPELAESPLQDESRYGPLLDLVERLDGYPIHLGTHLGGFVIADKPITYYAPLQWAAKGVAVIQFNKDDVADLGLVKMDILGLRTHSAVSETVHIIRQRTGRTIDPYALAPADPAAYEIISNGGSIGLFQLESAGQRNLATRLQERTFDDIIAAIALYRPGPLEAEMIGPFVDRRWGYEKVSLPHPSMAEALGDTYGVILYQEQVLRVAQLVAGFSPAEADSLRRAMTRDKSREEMAKIGATFVHHAVERGVPEEAAREVFRQLEGFAAYGFNKSHSVCFAVISYATAYLKAHYPAEFLCAVQNNQPMGFYTPRTVLNDARRFGLEVRPLDINLSGRGFTVEDEVPPDPWAHGDPIVAYDPFAVAWTAAHDWGLTPEDRAELEALHGQGGTDEPTQAGRTSFLLKNDALSVPAPTPPVPGDLPLPHADRARARAGVAPDACLAPAGALAPGAGRALRVGLRYLKQMSERALKAIEQERRYAPFSSFEDFYLRTRVERPVAENLIRVGAFDSLEPDRTELLWRLPILHDRREALAAGGGGNRGQLRAFFAQPERSGLTRDWSVEDKVRVELELLGLTVTCHPLELYAEQLEALGVTPSYGLPALGDEVPVTVAGVYERAQNPWMRSGRRTMFLTLEDAYGLFECVVFESKLARYAPVVARATYFLIRGRLQNNRKRGLAIVVEEIRDLEEVLAGLEGRGAAASAQESTGVSAAFMNLGDRHRRGVEERPGVAPVLSSPPGFVAHPSSRWSFIVVEIG